jgi:hypothetical protein
MENNLLKTGNWYWRTGEISLKDYYTLPSASRKQHIEFILTLDKSQRSTTDNIILLVSRAKEEEKKFFEL